VTGPDWIQWGRAKRGYAWHTLTPFGAADGRRDAALCSLDHEIVEATQGQPPRGARVCSACGRRAAELARAVDTALAQEVVDCKSTAINHDDNTRTATARVVRIEPVMDTDDQDAVADMLQRASDKRNGRTPLPIDLRTGEVRS
jgi:hypothetical protein